MWSKLEEVIVELGVDQDRNALRLVEIVQGLKSKRRILTRSARALLLGSSSDA